ncbi:MAG TPA: hypothetical protein VIF62_30160 [Labilithrix sp.]
MIFRRAVWLAPVVILLLACSRGAGAPAFEPSRTPEAESGRVAARAMLGLAATPETADDMADYEDVAALMIAIVERREPGVFDRFGADVAARDGDRFVTAWNDMRARLDAVATSDELADAVRSDPAFAGVDIQSIDPSAIGASDWSYTPPNDGVPNLGRGPDGWFGDGQIGVGAAIRDARGLFADPFFPGRTLARVDDGTQKPDPSSRLGAYACTGGHEPGTVGDAVHHAIGFIYEALGTYGEEKIGRVFCDPQAQALLDDPVDSPSSVRIAQIEQRYWQNVKTEDPASPGGRLGAAFNPASRDFLQRRVFGARRGTNAAKPLATPKAAADAGADAAKSPSDCRDKSDGWWCIYEGSIGWMALCKGGSTSLGCGCAACAGQGGTPAPCSCN